MRSLPLYAGFLLAAFTTPALAQTCTFPTPEGFIDTSAPGAPKAIVENIARENIVVKTRLSLRAPATGTLDEGVKAAQAEELAALGDKPDFELVRTDSVQNPSMPNRLLVYRYRQSKDGKVLLRFHAVFALGFQVVHAVGDSQATIIDALEFPHREAGLHERWLRRALGDLRCAK